VQFVFHKGRAGFHQQTGDLVLHSHRLLHHQVAVAQQASYIPLRRQHIAGWQQVAAQQIGEDRVALRVLSNFKGVEINPEILSSVI